jgi:two-component system cell cycle response regulator
VKILIAEDDPVSRRLLEVFLGKWGYDVVVTSDGNEAWEMLQGQDVPNLVISDWMMPQIDGLELCRRICAMERPDYTYFIILTAKGGKHDVVQGLEAGADDYLVKPFDQNELKYRVKIGERIITLEHRIRQLAATDPLTGILNRRAFIERMEDEINRAYRQAAPLCLLLADIDYFKHINDSYGHQIGDLVLQRFADTLSSASRRYDFVGRYGGEEFVVCLPGIGLPRARSVAGRLRKRVQEMKISTPASSKPIRITASFGVSCVHSGSMETVDPIIRRADEAMYRAKHEGRNRVCIVPLMNKL